VCERAKRVTRRERRHKERVEEADGNIIGSNRFNGQCEARDI